MPSKILTTVLTALLLSIFFVDSTDAQRMRLRSNINPDCTRPSGTSTTFKFADIYADGNIAVQGTFSCRGVFIYDITDPDNPVVASHYNPGNNIQFLEAIVVGNRGYFGSGNGFGVHIVDLSDPFNPTLLAAVNPSNGNGFTSIHEMVVDGDLLYTNFNGFSNKLIRVINISDPANAVFVRDINPTEVRWVHAMHIRGNRMFTSGWGTNSTRGRTEIYDISNVEKSAPQLLGFIEDQRSVTAGNRMHSSWSSEDGNFLYSARETTGGDGDVRTYNITNPAEPMLVDVQTMQGLELNAVTPHNPVVMGNYLYVSWYQAGLQVFDITEPSAPKKIAEYDTFPDVFAPDPAEKSLVDESFDIVCGNENLQNLLPTTYAGNWAVFPFLGTDKVLTGDMRHGLFVVDASSLASTPSMEISDFDGDRKTDHSTFKPEDGTWTVDLSGGGETTLQFGAQGDQVVTGDFDGDSKSDFAVFRESNGVWYIRRSSDETFDFRQFGAPGDIPVPADYDADGKTDIAVYRPDTGVWYILQSEIGLRVLKWGIPGDVPFAGDFEGDGKADLGIFRPNGGVWYVLKSSSSLPIIFNFGIGSDKPVVADFDGDEKSDFAVYRPSEGNWYIINSGDESLSVVRFGIEEDIPIPSDFDGDGKSDIALYRPSSSVWYRINSSDNSFGSRSFGSVGDIPSPTSIQPGSID